MLRYFIVGGKLSGCYCCSRSHWMVCDSLEIIGLIGNTGWKVWLELGVLVGINWECLGLVVDVHRCLGTISGS